MVENLQLDEIQGINVGLTGIGILALIIITIFDGLDNGDFIEYVLLTIRIDLLLTPNNLTLNANKWFYTTLMVVLTYLNVKNLKNAREKSLPLQNGPVFFFVLVWLGINAFDNQSVLVYFIFFSLNLKTINSLLFLPLAIYWFQPHNSDNFFGFTEITEDIKRRSIWKFSVIILLLIRIFNLPPVSEVLILIPLIAEPMKIYNETKDEMPLLTLHIQQELMDKFAVPISMAKGIFFIMISFTFDLIEGNLWLLVILAYFGAAFVWFIDFVVPEEARNSSNSKTNRDRQKELEILAKSVGISIEDTKKDIENKRKVVKTEIENTRDTMKEVVDTLKDSTKTTSSNPPSDDIVVVNSKTSLIQTPSDDNLPQLDENATIGEKAHALGRRVRSELQKPQYNLNHIMSTLSKEDFSKAFRVPQDNLIFNSTEGNWSPPKDLILFPLELEEYDYRRTNEILLLGFNKPISSSNAKIHFNFGSDNKYNTKISGNQVQIGDTTFHMKTLVLTREQWENAKISLEIVNDIEDISYTGFKTLQDLQEKLSQMSEKWLELRKQAEEAAINFLAGLLGSQDPIFLGKNQLKQQLVEASDYQVEDFSEEE